MVLSDILEFIIGNGCVADWDSTVTPPAVLGFDTVLSFEVLDFLSLKMGFDKVSSQINGYGAVSCAFRHGLEVNVSDQVDLSA